MKKFISFFLVALLGGLVFLAIAKGVSRKNGGIRTLQDENMPVIQTGGSMSAVIGPDFTSAADVSVHAVVHIKTELRQRNDTYNNFFDLFNDFFSNPYGGGFNQPVIATGSGVIISADGYIVTNNHVVQGADKLEVTLNDKRTYEASIIGTDPSTDLALIKVEAENLPFLVYGDSDNLRVGEWVLAVGNPFNLTSTVTAGIVSAKARDINILGANSAIESFIQTDAVVNRGNSGGALVNTSGELIGINAAIASNTGSYTGYSFAIPVNIVKKVIDDFLNFGEIQRAYLGISFAEIDSKLAEEKNLKDLKGVYIMDVLENGAASDAGLKEGDVIIKIENNNINSKSELLEAVGRHRPGDKIMVTIVRDKNQKLLEVTLRNRTGSTDVVKNDKLKILGASYEVINDKDKENLGIKHGVKITTLDYGKMRSSGIREGFIIMFIDREPVQTVEDVERIIKNKDGGILIEGIYPNGQMAYYGLGL